MRYYLTKNTLVVRGTFNTCFTNAGDIIKNSTTLLNHPMDKVPRLINSTEVIERIIRQAGLNPSTTLGIVCPVSRFHYSIARYDEVIVFTCIGINQQNLADEKTGSPFKNIDTQIYINIICVIDGEISDFLFPEIFPCILKGKETALSSMQCALLTTEGHSVIASHTIQPTMQTHGVTPPYKKIHQAVIRSVCSGLEDINQTDTKKGAGKPSFFIHTTIGGDRWVEWHKEKCPYYPCHFKGQRCDFCYCPLYPCMDESLGEWSKGKNKNGKVWSCAPCTLNHQPIVTRHLRANPEASLNELKSLLLHQEDCIKKS